MFSCNKFDPAKLAVVAALFVLIGDIIAFILVVSDLRNQNK